MTESHVILPVTGMTCANCAALIESGLDKLSYVDNASVNLASERVMVQYDLEKLSLLELVANINGSGYGVIKTSLKFRATNLVDDNDARSLESYLIKCEGVLSCRVNYLSGNATVEYVSTIISDNDIQNEIVSAGFKYVLDKGHVDDAPEASRKQELAKSKRLLLVASILTVPILALSMASKMSWIADDAYLTSLISWIVGVARAY